MNNRELQSLRNMGGICEEAADDITILIDKIEKLEAEIKKLKQIEAAAHNLIAVKGRYHSEIAYKHLCTALGEKL